MPMRKRKPAGARSAAKKAPRKKATRPVAKPRSARARKWFELRKVKYGRNAGAVNVVFVNKGSGDTALGRRANLARARAFVKSFESRLEVREID